MRFITNILFFLIFFFLINFCFYYFNDDYKGYLKKIKYDEASIAQDFEINDQYNPLLDETLGVIPSDNEKNTPPDIITVSDPVEEEAFDPELKILETTPTLENPFVQIEPKEVKKVVNSDLYKDVLFAFSAFNLGELEVHSSLFDLTTEYPKGYGEYYSRGLTLYTFDEAGYEEVMNILDVVSFDLPFSLKEINNFGEKNFYINLDERFQDSYVRIVILHENRVFGLKIKKDNYNVVKEILEENFSGK